MWVNSTRLFLKCSFFNVSNVIYRITPQPTAMTTFSFFFHLHNSSGLSQKSNELVVFRARKSNMSFSWFSSSERHKRAVVMGGWE